MVTKMLDIISDLFNFLSFIFSMIYSFLSWLWDIFIGLFTGDTWVLLWHACLHIGGTSLSFCLSFLPHIDTSFLSTYGCQINYFLPLDTCVTVLGIFLTSLVLIVPTIVLLRLVKFVV